MATLTISLPKPLKEFVDDQVSAGHSRNVSAFIAELVRTERKRRAEAKLVALVEEAEASGPSTPFTPEDWKRIQEEVMKQLAAEKENHAKNRKKRRSRV